MKEKNGISRNRVSWIDSLKGIALLGVIMIHSGGAELPSVLGKVGKIGNSGVQMFFIISAYLSFVSYSRYIQHEDSNIKSNLCWSLKKHIRIIPLYYLALVIYTLKGGAAYWYGSIGHITMWNVLSHIFFVNGFIPHHTNSILGVEWYLGVLVLFYYITPLLYKMINSLEKAVYWFMSSSVLCFVISKLCILLLQPEIDEYIYSNYFSVFWLPAQFPVLMLGILLYYILRSNVLEKIRYPREFSYVLLFISGFMIAGMIFEYNQILGIAKSTLYGIIFICIIFSQHLNSCRLIDNSIFRFLGKNSYPIYLFHFVVIDIFEKYVPEMSHGYILNWVIKYVGVVIVTTCISIFLLRFPDRWLNGRLNHLLRKWMKN